MRFTQGTLGMLVQRYRGILKKCHMLNVLGGVAISAFLMGVLAWQLPLRPSPSATHIRLRTEQQRPTPQLM